jgi:CRISPR-associated protein Cas2
MLTWVVYDITNDRQRGKSARACLQYGLIRVQKSVFLGTLAENERDELVVRLETLIDPDRDSVYVFPMCRPDFAKFALLGQAFDSRRVTDELRTLFV